MTTENEGAQTQELEGINQGAETLEKPKTDNKKAAKSERRAKAKAKAKETTTKQTNTTKKEKNLDKKNIEDKAKEVTRDLLYIYPGDLTSQDAKKTWRRKQRAQNKSYIKQIEELKPSHKREDIAKRKEIEAQYKKWRTETFTKG